MKIKYKGWNIFFVIIQALSVFVLIYTLLIKSFFTSIDTLNNHLTNAGVYNHLSAMIKAELISRIPPTQHALLTNTLAISAINAVVTPQLIQQFSKPALNIGINWIAKPATISNNNIVINTSQYKQQIKQAISERDLPQFLTKVGQELQNAIPGQITILDLNKHPHGIIPALVRGKIFYQNINTVNTVAVWSAILSIIALILINIRSIKRLLKSLSIAYASVSIIVLALSFLIPYVILPIFAVTNLDPVIQAEFNAMINDLANYIFSATRMPSLYILLGAGALYLLYRWSFVERLQTNIDKAFFTAHAPATASKKHTARHTSRTRHTTAALHRNYR